MDNKDIKKYILQISGFLLVCFLLLMLNVFYLQVIKADELADNPLNHRSSIGNTLRGAILDSNGKVLAESPQLGQRSYPYGAAAAPVTGYVGEVIGSAGTENVAGNELSGQSRQLSQLGPISQLLQANRGSDVKLTVDADIQELAYEELGDRRGAVVVIDASTGAIIAMVSSPSFNPENIDGQWEQLLTRQDSPIMNRAAQGLYPPGSTIKVAIADGALDEKVTDINEMFNCTGSLQVGNETIHESHGAVHGQVNLKEALTESCNVTFGTLALRMKGAALGDLFKRFGFDQSLKGELIESKLHLPAFNELGDGDTAQVGIGQADLLVTPLRMAMVAAAFGNGGIMMRPYLIDEVVSTSGIVIRKASPEKWLEVTSSQRASIIDNYMEQVVKSGTGTAAAVSGVRVTGKTGTAENSAGADHGWFIGTATLPKRKIAFAIIVENSGGGGTIAAPIAGDIIQALLRK